MSYVRVINSWSFRRRFRALVMSQRDCFTMVSIGLIESIVFIAACRRSSLVVIERLFLLRKRRGKDLKGSGRLGFLLIWYLSPQKQLIKEEMEQLWWNHVLWIHWNTHVQHSLSSSWYVWRLFRVQDFSFNTILNVCINLKCYAKDVSGEGCSHIIDFAGGVPRKPYSDLPRDPTLSMGIDLVSAMTYC